MEETYQENFTTGKVLKIFKEDYSTGQGITTITQDLLILRDDGTQMTLPYSAALTTQEVHQYQPKDRVVLQETVVNGESHFTLFEPYRLDGMLTLGILLVVIAIVIGGKRGASSIVGLIMSLGIISYWVLPQLTHSSHTLLITMIAAMILSFLTMYVAHGFNKKTTLSFLSTILTLGLAFFLGNFAIDHTNLLGLGTESSIDLTLGGFPQLNLKGLLLGSMLLATVGILDDITIGQTAIVHELHETNKRLSAMELFKKSLNVGREHIASLINTLVIVYLGTALPLILMISISPNPLWVILNNEPIAEEIVRSLLGSMALILAVPIASAIAAKSYAPKKSPN